MTGHTLTCIAIVAGACFMWWKVKRHEWQEEERRRRETT
jgi:hypothetical protein